MRIKLRVKDLKKGDLAFLPYWGVLRKARVTKIGTGVYVNRRGETIIPVFYKMVSPNLIQNEAMCSCNAESEYEVYVRPPR